LDLLYFLIQGLKEKTHLLYLMTREISPMAREISPYGDVTGHKYSNLLELCKPPKAV
jgi:hypothetical protein